MRLLLIGSGGREHALAWKFKQEDPSLELIAAPGNPGIAQLGECVSISATDIEGLESLARERAVDLTVVGPEASLALGVVDRFEAAGLPIFGPTKAAAEIETSKAFSKQLMLEEGIPTARAEMHTDVREAKEAIRRFGAPVVVKASGLAAGKGVIVCSSIKEADRAVEDMLQGNRFGAAGAEVLIEEFMEGEEISIFAISDGHSFTVLPGLQDHKRLLNGDLGANTGGMGAYVPVTLKDPTEPMATPGSDSGGYSVSLTMSATLGVFAPTIRGLAARGRPFKGLLYAGLMITAEGPKVVEFNCRFGDPETQALMPVLGMRLLDLMVPISRGERIFGYPADGVFDDVSPRTVFSYNVGPADWIGGDEAPELLGPAFRLPLPVWAVDVVNRLARLKPGHRPAGAMPYSRSPWVVAVDRLRATGWSPQSTSAEAFVASERPSAASRFAARHRQEVTLGIVATAGIAVLGAVGWLIARSRRRRRGGR